MIQAIHSPREHDTRYGLDCRSTLIEAYRRSHTPEDHASESRRSDPVDSVFLTRFSLSMCLRQL